MCRCCRYRHGTGSAWVGQLVLYLMILLTWLIPGLRKTRPGGVLFYFGISQMAMAVAQPPAWPAEYRQPATWEKGAMRGRSCQFDGGFVIRLGGSPAYWILRHEFRTAWKPVTRPAIIWNRTPIGSCGSWAVRPGKRGSR